MKTSVYIFAGLKFGVSKKIKNTYIHFINENGKEIEVAKIANNDNLYRYKKMRAIKKFIRDNREILIGGLENSLSDLSWKISYFLRSTKENEESLRKLKDTMIFNLKEFKSPNMACVIQDAKIFELIEMAELQKSKLRYI